MNHLARKLRKALRGEVSVGVLLREAARRAHVKIAQSRERRLLHDRNGSIDATPRLTHAWQSRPTAELLAHFRTRHAPCFLPGIDNQVNVGRSDDSATDFAKSHIVSTDSEKLQELHRTVYADETSDLIERAERIVNGHEWRVLGYGEIAFGEQIDWLRDPVSGARWSPDFHADIEIVRGDGSDIRTLWEVNRLGHLLTLAQSYFITNDERYTGEIFAQLASWQKQNPTGFGANWACAMEVALRAINLLAAFGLIRTSSELNEDRLTNLLALFDEHAAHIRRNLEFSYLTTSNHYLSNIVGLLWLGVLLPELEGAVAWRTFALRELECEIDKQILDDGADDESSTGYHHFVLELLFYSLVLCDQNGVRVSDHARAKIRRMFDYSRALVRPDGLSPLVGDADSGRVLAFNERRTGDYLYLLDAGATYYENAKLKVRRTRELLMGEPIANERTADEHSVSEREVDVLINKPSVETLWLLGAAGVARWRELKPSFEIDSKLLPNAGAIVMRGGSNKANIHAGNDLYLHFNMSGAGLGGRGSHAHNDKLSIEVACCGRSFIVDPGSYVYSADLDARHTFRSTRYHSTVEVDGAEQNTIERALPFVIGNEANPRLVGWQTNERFDLAVAEHDGYRRLTQSVTHRRAVFFDKSRGFWLIEDALLGAGAHTFRFRFHFAPELKVESLDTRTVVASTAKAVTDQSSSCELVDEYVGDVDTRDVDTRDVDTRDLRLFVIAVDKEGALANEEGQSVDQMRSDVELEYKFVSRDYGARKPSVAACWTRRAIAPTVARWLLLPVCATDDERERLQIVEEVRSFDLTKLMS